MTSAELADRILNFQCPQGGFDGGGPTLAGLVQMHHDAVVQECADLCLRAAKRALKRDRAVLLTAVEEIRALKGCE